MGGLLQSLTPPGFTSLLLYILTGKTRGFVTSKIGAKLNICYLKYWIFFSEFHKGDKINTTVKRFYCCDIITEAFEIGTTTFLKFIGRRDAKLILAIYDNFKMKNFPTQSLRETTIFFACGQRVTVKINVVN